MTPQYYLSELARPAEFEVLVSQADFELALVELSPSVSEGEMLHYAQVQKQFQGPPSAIAEAGAQDQGPVAQADQQPQTNGVLHGAQVRSKAKGKGRARD